MFVIATAGHVDHGKSTLVRALTGMEPDRWAEERRRGMTIDLGFAWTTLSTGETVAFVDVPGHERFVPNMLAGVGPVPAALLVVAADDGWMPQTAEHVAALSALGVEHAVVAVSRADLTDPQPAMAEATARLAATPMRAASVVPVSAITGLGLDELREALHHMLFELPEPDLAAPVRLWIDRSFTIRGSGTVVTGTLTAGTLITGDELMLGERPVRVRGLQSLGTNAGRVDAVARVAVNLRGVEKADATRGDALLTPGGWRSASDVDARITLASEVDSLPAEPILHIGSAAVSVHVRPLGHETAFARLRLRRPLPLAPGDVALLRDPGRHLILGTITVLDVAPPPLSQRGAAAARAAELAELSRLAGLSGSDEPNQSCTAASAQLRRHRIIRESALAGAGLTTPAGAVRAGDWLIDDAQAQTWARQLTELVSQQRNSRSFQPGPTVEQARLHLGAPDTAVVAALAPRAEPPLAILDGRLIDPAAIPALPETLAEAVHELMEELTAHPFSAPEAGRLAELHLGPKELAVAERAGALLRLAPGVVLLPNAVTEAVRLLTQLPQPFTLSQARQHLGTSRRVAVPLLEFLDQHRLTRRLPDDRREVF